MSWVKEKDVIHETKKLGMNAVRLLIFWAAVEPQKGIYDEEYLERLAKRVKWYTDNGAWVILDMHQDIYGYAVHGNGAPGWATDVGPWEKIKNKKITEALPKKLNNISTRRLEGPIKISGGMEKRATSKTTILWPGRRSPKNLGTTQVF